MDPELVMKPFSISKENLFDAFILEHYNLDILSKSASNMIVCPPLARLDPVNICGERTYFRIEGTKRKENFTL